MAPNDSSGWQWLVLFIIGSPILLIVLGVIGLAALTSFLVSLFDFYLIAISLAGVGLLTAVSKRGLQKSIPVFAVVAGFLYWAYNIWVFITTNTLANFFCSIPILGQALCGAATVVTVPALIADILVILFWSSILGVIAKKV